MAADVETELRLGSFENQEIGHSRVNGVGASGRDREANRLAKKRRISSRFEDFIDLNLNPSFRIVSINLFQGPSPVLNLGHFYKMCIESTHLHVATSCFSVWKNNKYINGFAKMIPAVRVKEPQALDHPMADELRVCVFFFDDNIEFGGHEDSPGICNLRDLETGKFVEFCSGANGFIRECTARHTIIHHSTEYRNVLVKANILDALEDTEYFCKIIRKYAQPDEKILVFMDVNSTIVCQDTSEGKEAGLEAQRKAVEEAREQQAREAKRKADEEARPEAQRKAEEEARQRQALDEKARLEAQRKAEEERLQQQGLEGRGGAPQQQALEGSTAESRGGAAQEDVSGSLLSSMFELIEATPHDVVDFSWDPYPPIKLEKKISLKQLVKRITDGKKEHYAGFFKADSCRKMVERLASLAELRWSAQCGEVTAQSFSALYAIYLGQVNAKLCPGGITKSWFRCFEFLIADRNTVVLNSYGDDTRKVVVATVPDERQVMQIAVNFELWHASDKEKFEEQFKDCCKTQAGNDLDFMLQRPFLGLETILEDDDTLEEYLDQIDLPPPWEKRYQAPEGKMYFYDPRSNSATWVDPRFVPENWGQSIDPNTGKVFFTFQKTRQTTSMDPRGCPKDWCMRLSNQGEVYFLFLPKMMTTWLDPRGLPEGFGAVLDDRGRLYFQDYGSKTTTWQDPRQDQAEVTLANWRQEEMVRWLRNQVMEEIEEQYGSGDKS